MIERKDNTKTMAMCGRILLSLLIFNVWIVSEVFCGELTSIGAGFMSAGRPDGDNRMLSMVLGISLNLIITLTTLEIGKMIWLGPKKEKKDDQS